MLILLKKLNNILKSYQQLSLFRIISREIIYMPKWSKPRS